MRVLFVLADNIYLTPYLRMYTTILDETKTEYDVFYWDKNNNEMPISESFIRFSAKNNSLFYKILGYISYRNTLKKRIKKIQYDFIICLHTIANFLFFKTLYTQYSGKYIFDVRDYSYEKYRFIRLLEKYLTRHSAINIVSSSGFISFLPQSKYYVVHNLPTFESNSIIRSPKPYSKEGSPIVISYIGLVRFFEQNKRIIDFFANDMRFELRYIGTNSEVLNSYCKEKKIRNVVTKGTFSSEKTLNYFFEADLVMNLYGNHTPLLDFALSNKLYYAAYLYRPILVCTDTYMEKISKKAGFGFSLELSKSSEKDELVKYYTELNRNELKKNCDSFLNSVIKEHNFTIKKIRQLFD